MIPGYSTWRRTWSLSHQVLEASCHADYAIRSEHAGTHATPNSRTVAQSNLKTTKAIWNTSTTLGVFPNPSPDVPLRLKATGRLLAASDASRGPGPRGRCANLKPSATGRAADDSELPRPPPAEATHPGAVWRLAVARMRVRCRGAGARQRRLFGWAAVGTEDIRHVF